MTLHFRPKPVGAGDSESEQHDERPRHPLARAAAHPRVPPGATCRPNVLHRDRRLRQARGWSAVPGWHETRQEGRGIACQGATPAEEGGDGVSQAELAGGRQHCTILLLACRWRSARRFARV